MSSKLKQSSHRKAAESSAQGGGRRRKCPVTVLNSPQILPTTPKVIDSKQRVQEERRNYDSVEILRPAPTNLPPPRTSNSQTELGFQASCCVQNISLRSREGETPRAEIKNWNATKSKRGIRATVAMARLPNGRTAAVELRSQSPDGSEQLDQEHKRT